MIRELFGVMHRRAGERGRAPVVLLVLVLAAVVALVVVLARLGEPDDGAAELVSKGQRSDVEAADPAATLVSAETESSLPDPSLDAASERAIEPLASAEAEGEVELPAPEAPMLVGRLVELDGAPIPKGTVWYMPHPATILASYPRDRALGEWLADFPQATSSDDGRFTLPLTSSIVEATTTVTGEPPSLLAAAERHALAGLLLPARFESTRDIGDLALEPGATARGRVVTVQREAVPGARVWVDIGMPTEGAAAPELPRRDERASVHRWLSCNADGEGLFEIAGVPFGREITLVAQADGFAPGRIAMGAVANEDRLQGLQIEVQPGARLVAFVQDARGTAIQDAQVYAVPVATNPHVAAQQAAQASWLRLPDVRLSGVRGSRLPDGAFAIEGLTEPTYDVYAEANGYEPERVRASLSSTTPVVIELANESSARVRVVDASTQQPVKTAVVQAWAVKGGGFLNREATHADVESVGDGEFLVKGLGKQKTTLFVTAPGHAARMETIPGVEPGATVEHVVSLGLEGRVSGTMTTRDGGALAGVTVSATMPVGLDGGVIDARPTRLESVTGATGEYELRGVGKGEWILHASLPKHVSVYETITLPQDGIDTEWSRVLVAGATITGVLRLSNGRVLVDNDVHASLVSPEAPLPRLGLKTSFSAQTGSQGEFVLEGLAPGTWQVGGKRGVQVTLKAGETRPLDVVLPTPATIVGRVISGDGAAVDAFVVAQQIDGKSRRMGRTNALGEFEIVAHAQGEFSVQATCLAQPLGLTEVARVTCQEGRVARCDLQVGGCMVSGRCLTGPDRKPFPGAMVVFARDGVTGGSVLYFESDGDKTMLWPVSDQEGRFAFQLSPGKYFVTASADGYLTSGETLEITAADTSATVDIELTAQ